jgi:hypothetical protein
MVYRNNVRRYTPMSPALAEPGPQGYAHKVHRLRPQVQGIRKLTPYALYALYGDLCDLYLGDLTCIRLFAYSPIRLFAYSPIRGLFTILRYLVLMDSQQRGRILESYAVPDLPDLCDPLATCAVCSPC